jgi:mono/diheme cytochrome c family protein
MSRILLVIVFLLAIVVAIFVSRTWDTKPEPAPDPEAAKLERGRYLVEHVMHCAHCHSPMDVSKPGFPPVEGMKGAGWAGLDPATPFVNAPNITPHVTANWKDEMFANAIRNGIGDDGQLLFPLMPYHYFRVISDDDLAAVIAYVKTWEPVENEVPDTQVPPPLKALLQAPPPITGGVPPPDRSDPVKYGEYLVNLGNCQGCHTPLDMKTAQPRFDLAFGGGFRITGVWGDTSSANLTPDASGISYYDEALFFQVMREGRVQARKLNDLMPWIYFRGMTDEDLRAIFAYLKTLKPVAHRVDNTEPPTPCRICNFEHGAGEQN